MGAVVDAADQFREPASLELDWAPERVSVMNIQITQGAPAHIQTWN